MIFFAPPWFFQDAGCVDCQFKLVTFVTSPCQVTFSAVNIPGIPNM